MRHLAGWVVYRRKVVDLTSSVVITTIDVWCGADILKLPNDGIVFEAALSDCEACQAARSKALHDVRPNTTTK